MKASQSLLKKKKTSSLWKISNIQNRENNTMGHSGDVVIIQLLLLLLILGPLHFYMNFRVNLSLSTKTCWNFDLNCVKSIYKFGDSDFLTILSLPTHEHVIALNLFRSLVYLSIIL